MNVISYLCHLFLFVSVVISNDDSNGRSFFFFYFILFFQSKRVACWRSLLATFATATSLFVKSSLEEFIRQMKDNHKTKLVIKMKLGLEI